MPARSSTSRHHLVCADCGTPLTSPSPSQRRYGWKEMAAVGCATLFTTAAFVLSSLSSETRSLAEAQHKAHLSADAADE
jgi:hypothetical protein